MVILYNGPVPVIASITKLPSPDPSQLVSANAVAVNVGSTLTSNTSTLNGALEQPAPGVCPALLVTCT